MLSVKSYSPAYRAQCRARYDTLIKGMSGVALAPDIETRLCNELVLALDNSFCHRMRGQEGKDGNPLNEVRMLAASIQNDKAILSADTTIKYDGKKAVTGLAVGDAIALDRAAFATLASSFLDEIDRRFG